jgi:VanZ family protein
MTAVKLTWLWLPPVAWMILIFIGSSIPGGSIDQPPEYFVAAHFMEYLVLCLFLLRALNGGVRQPVLLGVAASALALCVAYGILDELHQLFVPGRVSDPLDVAVDTIGATVACAIVLLIAALSRRNQTRVRAGE